MAVQETLAVMRRQPLRDEFAAGFHVALLEHRMRQAMRGIGVGRSQLHRAFAQGPSFAQVSGFGMRPAEIAGEPPVLAVMRGVTQADRELGGVMVGAARECVEAEGAEQQRQHQRIARIFVQMRLGAAGGEFRFAVDHRGHDLDMADFPRRRACDQFAGARGHGAGFLAFHVELMQAGARDMRQREAGIFRDRAVEGGLGAVPGRQHAVDAVAVMRRGLVGSGRQQQIISVPVHFYSVVTRGAPNLAET